MLPASNDALLEAVIGPEQIAALAILYDRFAHALDPLSDESEQAEKTFLAEAAEYYDFVYKQKPDLVKNISQHDFRKAIILRCRKHLKATEKKSGI